MNKTLPFIMVLIISLSIGYKVWNADKVTADHREPALELISHIQSMTQEPYTYTLKQSGYTEEKLLVNADELKEIYSSLVLPMNCSQEEKTSERRIQCSSSDALLKMIITERMAEDGLYYLARLEGILSTVSMKQLQQWTKAVQNVFHTDATGYGWNVLVEADESLHTPHNAYDLMRVLDGLNAKQVDTYTDQAMEITSYYAEELATDHAKDFYANLQLIEHENTYENEKRVILTYPMISSEF
ncbi:hypothetical protein [Marinicrinis lubricantis]|uniref:Uncharacterized protein n=1 Tax=Marinicrinis lubricantis TaxID=2086470 RepID=A0ABW1IJA7_9BACL